MGYIDVSIIRTVHSETAPLEPFLKLSGGMAEPFFCESCSVIYNTGELSEGNVYLLDVEGEVSFLSVEAVFGYFPEFPLGC